MDESSSRFVDRLVTEKLVSEKLSKVHHRPTEPLSALLHDSGYCPIALLERTFRAEQLSANQYRLESLVDSDFDENRWIPVLEHGVPEARGTILLSHGLFEDNRAIYGFLIGELNRLGYSVYVTTLPFHYERRPSASSFSGEFFFSAELGRTKRAFLQASLELLQTYRWLTHRSPWPTYVVGFSMGGSVALSAALQAPDISGLCLLNPAAMLSEVLWTSPLCTTVKNDLLSAGFSPDEVNPVLSTFDPTAQNLGAINRERTLLLCGQYDLVTQPWQYEEVARRLCLRHIHRYKSGHLNLLRVPRLGEDIARFFDSCTNAERTRIEATMPSQVVSTHPELRATGTFAFDSELESQ